MPTFSDARRRMAAIALCTVLGLVGAPVAQVLSDKCQLCPATCPMHHAGQKARKPTCHAGSAGHGAAEHDESGARFSRPPCGHSAAVPAIGVGPMILNDAGGEIVHPIARSVPDSLDRRRMRLAEPPDTRPPIFFPA